MAAPTAVEAAIAAARTDGRSRAIATGPVPRPPSALHPPTTRVAPAMILAPAKTSSWRCAGTMRPEVGSAPSSSVTATAETAATVSARNAAASYSAIVSPRQR